jgi:hypothetical protein
MKDPCCLFYWGDWTMGTMLFSRRHKGAYMDLLSAQFSGGHLTLENIKTILGDDFGMWDTVLKSKFKQDETGAFYNERLDIEYKRRQNYTQSKLKNLEGRADTRTDSRTEIVNRNRNRNRKGDIGDNKKGVIGGRKEGEKGGKQKNYDLSFVNEEFREVFEEWIMYKKSKNQNYKNQKSVEACYRNLLKLSMKSVTKARDVVDQSMGNNWQGLFPLKQTYSQGEVNKSRYEPKMFTGYIIKQENKANENG